MPIGPGTKLGSYVVEDFVGQGAMGVVYRAYHAQLERAAAVKVLQGLAPDTDSVARFRREAQSIGRMRHPNVLNVFDFGEFEGTPYMIVEYVEGGSLAARTKQGPMDRDTALRFLQGIGDALDYAHSLGIVHRDVKPANVLLGTHENPILADFGLAKLLQSSSIKSMTGVTTGTPAYMAPEQVTGSAVGPAADRYSLAVMAFEMLTGALPFDGSGVLEVLYAHVHRDPPAPSSVNPQLGASVDEVVLRGMAKEPGERWGSCSDFVAALRTALEASPSTAAKAVDSTVAMPPPAATPPLTPVAEPVAAIAAATAVMEPAPPAPTAATTALAMPPTPPKRRRRIALFAILAAALVLTLIVGAVVVYGATRPTTIAVQPQIVRAGEHVVVTAHHVPRDQTGDIQLGGPARTFPFRANSSGDVSVQIAVPREIGAGDYLVKICWNGTCHASTTLRVIAPVAFVSPGTSASPGTTPSASSSPTSAPTASPTHSTTSSPTPRVTPSSAPPPPAPTISVSPTSGIIPGSTSISVTGSNFTPNQLVTIYLVQGSTTTKVSTGASGSTGIMSLKKFTAPATTLPGAATVKACDQSNRCATQGITVV